MFICQCCQAQSSSGEPSFSKTLATRPKIYPARYESKKKEIEKKPFDAGGNGYEIVREIQVCQGCAET